MTAEALITRRRFLGRSAATAGAVSSWPLVLQASAEPRPLRVPLKIGIRAASLRMVGDLRVIRAAAAIPGIRGVELQVTGGKRNLRDWDVVRAYKREADRWAMHIPSLAGVWDQGVNLFSPRASESLRLSIRAAELLGASVILVAFFGKNAPDMNRESSYGPVVELLRSVAPYAADAGVTLGLESSLSPADARRLIELVDHPAVKVYYDVHNMAYYGHRDQAIRGIYLLGRDRICAVHVKNGSKLVEEPGPIDWAAALRALSDIGYDGWFIYETQHDGYEDCVRDTVRNNAYLRRHVRMPAVSVRG